MEKNLLCRVFDIILLPLFWILLPLIKCVQSFKILDLFLKRKCLTTFWLESQMSSSNFQANERYFRSIDLFYPTLSWPIVTWNFLKSNGKKFALTPIQFHAFFFFCLKVKQWLMADQLTGFYMMATLAFNELRIKGFLTHFISVVSFYTPVKPDLFWCFHSV